MTNITKPIGKRNRLVSKEEAKAMLERIEVPKSGLEEAFDLVNDNDVVYFQDYELVQSEYEALNEMTQRIYGKEAIEFFDYVSSNFENQVANLTADVYVKIVNKHIVEFHVGEDIRNKKYMNEIPKEVKSFSRLKNLSIHHQNIENIENLENFIELEILALIENNIDEIQGLETNVNLKELYLNGNKIKEIKNLRNNTKLERFYIPVNKLAQMNDDLSYLPKLKGLHIGKNPFSLRDMNNRIVLKRIEDRKVDIHYD